MAPKGMGLQILSERGCCWDQRAARAVAVQHEMSGSLASISFRAHLFLLFVPH